jgi:hypothetical protein
MRSRKEILMLNPLATASALFILGLVLICSPFHSSASNNAAKIVKQPPRTEKGAIQCPHCAPAGDQVIYIPLMDLPEAKESEIVFNSRSPKTMAVRPTFYKADGRELVGEVVRVDSAEIRYVKLKKLIPAGYREDRDWGGMTLSYYGNNREMWAQLRFLNVNGGNSVDEFFTVNSESRSDLYEAAWWAPKDSSSIVALGNLGDVASSVVVRFDDNVEQKIELGPHATELVRHESKEQPGAQSVSIRVTGVAGSVVPTGIIASADGSFNSVIRFYSPRFVKQAHLFATGFRVKDVTPHMVLKNTSSEQITALPKFITLAGIGAGQPVIIPEVTLAANETREIDLTQLFKEARGRKDLDRVSVEVLNSGPAGTLIGSLYGTDKNVSMNYETPLRDSGPIRTMTGSYPWKVSKDYTTIVYITNISDREAGFISQIQHDGDKYVIDPRTLKPGETAVFDLAKIRDEQMPDNVGRHIPRTTSIGQFKWAVRGVTDGKLLLIGRAEMVSRSDLVSTSYSCNDPCPPTYGGSIDPFLPPIVINGSAPTTIWEYAYYGSGFSRGPYSAGADWTVDNSSIASCDPASGHTIAVCGTQAGSGTLTGLIRMEESYGYDGRDCYDNNNQYEVGGNEPLDVNPVISGPSSLWWFNSATPSGYATQAILTTSCSGTSWDWNIVSGTSKVSLGSNGSCSITIFAAGASSTQNDVRITVTVNGMTSSIYTLTVRAPNSLSFVTQGTAANTPNGYTTLIQYQIRDQFGTILPSNVPINEHFTTAVTNDYSGTNWIRSNDGGSTVSPNGWSDQIQGQPISGAIPTPTGPCSPLCNTLVHHFDGEWSVGSAAAASGTRVQTNTWQRYIDHGAHTDVVSPAH